MALYHLNPKRKPLSNSKPVLARNAHGPARPRATLKHYHPKFAKRAYRAPDSSATPDQGTRHAQAQKITERKTPNPKRHEFFTPHDPIP